MRGIKSQRQIQSSHAPRPLCSSQRNKNAKDALTLTKKKKKHTWYAHTHLSSSSHPYATTPLPPRTKLLIQLT